MSELVFFDVVIVRPGRRGPLHRPLCGCDSARSSPSCFAAAASSSLCGFHSVVLLVFSALSFVIFLSEMSDVSSAGLAGGQSFHQK